MDREELWQILGLDLEAHRRLLEALGPLYEEIYLSRENRPQGMAYFDSVVVDIHGARVAELLQIRESGNPVVGTFCVFVPEEIIWAAGGACVGLCAGVEVAPERVDKVLPRNLCPLIKAFFGFKLARLCPYMEVCHFLVGETTCDGKKKAYEIFDRYKPIYVMQVPHKKDFASLELWIKGVRDFALYIEGVSGKPISTEDLREAIELINRRREALNRLNRLRCHDPPPISGRDALLINQLAFFDDPERFTVRLNELCDELEERVRAGEGVCPSGTTRIVLSGCPMAIPNWKVPYLVESTGAVIVAEESCVGTRHTRELVQVSENSKEGLLRALAERYFRIDCAIFTPNPERRANLDRMVREFSAHGIIHYALKFCDPYTIEAYQIEEGAPVPVLKIETDYSQEDREQLRTRIEAFLEILR
ncbi:double-cubane-cluster-containing anaerobic reductase [Thermosulfurimonas sp. F29]|uniref:double-cubane-cluster-containing anaerobic reductase n=1 Tax=Thermosulfurimonas sp. F29 TaxID=2867247 RepID=UPI001C82D8A3|nr:double-cubane-cluster-containing anaerobic reductase [Thermosulfurimonas sp. F29]MBX6423078.1 2-hydroxyacyl-CoA dehydratase family protein [Thermosulfurimonas sp. F29]